MRTLLKLSLLVLLSTVAQADNLNDGSGTLDNFQVPPMSFPNDVPLEQALPPNPSTSGYAPGVNVQTIPTPLQQTGTQTRTMTTPLQVDASLNFTDLMTDEVTLQYQYYYQDAAIIPWRQDAAVFANHNQDQSAQIPRFSDVIYLSLFLVPAGRGPLECMPSAVGQAPRLVPESNRMEVLSKVLPQVNRVQVIGTTDANGNGICQVVFS